MMLVTLLSINEWKLAKVLFLFCFVLQHSAFLLFIEIFNPFIQLLHLGPLENLINEQNWTLMNMISEYILALVEHHLNIVNISKAVNIIEHQWTSLKFYEHHWALVNISPKSV